MRRLHLVVGPNGAGKSTFVQRRLAPALPLGIRFVNADEIARHGWPDEPEAHSYEAARIAAETRSKLIMAGESFIAETVFSHPSKLDLIDEAHSAGYVVVLHVVLVPEQLTIPRVRLRVQHGGHDVPTDKVLERYRRLWPLVADAIARVDHASVYDNAGNEPALVAKFAGGELISDAAWPEWTPPALMDRWPGDRP